MRLNIKSRITMSWAGGTIEQRAIVLVLAENKGECLRVRVERPGGVRSERLVGVD